MIPYLDEWLTVMAFIALFTSVEMCAVLLLVIRYLVGKVK